MAGIKALHHLLWDYGFPVVDQVRKGLGFKNNNNNKCQQFIEAAVHCVFGYSVIMIN